MTDQSPPDPAYRDLDARMARGTAWVVAMRMAIRLLGVLSTVILARLLEPSDYGLIALATVLAATVELLSEFNFEVWLIRHASPTRAHFDTVWTLSLVRGAVTAALLWLLSAPMGAFFDEPRLPAVVELIAIAILISSARNIGIVDFQKDLHFDKDFRFNASVKICAFFVTVGLGFLWRNYWALAAGIVTGHVIQFLLSYRMHDFRPRLSLAHVSEALGFSKWLLAGNILSFAHTRADTLILGKIAGGQVLGLYTVAREIANLASTELTMPIRRVMLPGYAKLQADVAILRRTFVRDFGLIVLVAAPCAVGIGVAADPIVRVLLGPKWLDAIPVLQALTLYGVAMIGMANQWPALVALGRTRAVSVLLAAGLLVLLPLLYFGSTLFGVVGAALALGVSNSLLFLGGLVLVRVALDFRWPDLWSVVWRTLVATVSMAIVVLFLQRAIAPLPDLLVLPACVITGVATYVLVLAVLARMAGSVSAPEQIVATFLREKLLAVGRAMRAHRG